MGNVCARRRAGEAEGNEQEILQQAGLLGPAKQGQSSAEAEDVDSWVPPEVEPAKKINRSNCHSCWQKPGGSICRRCNKVKYCCSQCQKSHWPEHKQFCGKDDGHLRHLWGAMTMECCLKKQATFDLTKHRQFVQHAGPAFWYNDKGYNILHVLVGIAKSTKLARSQEFAKQNIETIVQEAVNFNVDINARCDTGETPLHLACKDASPESQWITSILLKHPGIEFSVRDNEGQTSEEVSALDSTKVLFQQRHQADRIAAEERQQKEAEEKRQANALYREDLQKRLAATPKRDRCRECWEPGRLICRRCNKVRYCSPECQKNNWEVHSQVCGKKLLDLAELFQGTLANAIESRSSDGLQTFVQHLNGDVCIDFERGLWIAHGIACFAASIGPAPAGDSRGSIESLLQDLLDFDIDVNAQTKTGDTPLHILCSAANGAGALMATWLLERAPVDIRVRNEAELTPLDCCIAAGMKPDESPEFVVALTKADDEKLGLSIGPYSEEPHSLLVHSVADDGAVATWNASNPPTAVLAGDIIIEVNGAREDTRAKLEELKSAKAVQLKLRRGYHKMLQLLSGEKPLGALRQPAEAADSAEEQSPEEEPLAIHEQRDKASDVVDVPAEADSQAKGADVEN
mmetsp:Transcript_65358/g.156259  ORF Transcript_65358/g.156259 Transcript_65358/m.156259 type:complete len:631 (-) Transcript_65358:80-1972(-)